MVVLSMVLLHVFLQSVFVCVCLYFNVIERQRGFQVRSLRKIRDIATAACVSSRRHGCYCKFEQHLSHTQV